MKYLLIALFIVVPLVAGGADLRGAALAKAHRKFTHTLEELDSSSALRRRRLGIEEAERVWKSHDSGAGWEE